MPLAWGYVFCVKWWRWNRALQSDLGDWGEEHSLKPSALAGAEKEQSCVGMGNRATTDCTEPVCTDHE